jgi:integrase
MGVTVRQKVKGKGQPWWVFISGNGKRTSRKVGDKKAADAVASKIRAKLQPGEFGFVQKKRRIPLFKDYAVGFLETYSAMNHKESTTESYQSVLKNHVNPAIGDKQLDEITKQDIKDLLLQKRQDGLSPATVKLIKAYTAPIFECAVGDDELIEANPVRSLGKKTQEMLREKNSGREDINPLTRDELKRLLDTINAEFSAHYPFCLLLARTGMRVGEALALQWGDFDFNSRFIEVRRQYSKGRIFSPKSNKSRRVDMSRQLSGALLTCQVQRKRPILRFRRSAQIRFH